MKPDPSFVYLYTSACSLAKIRREELGGAKVGRGRGRVGRGRGKGKKREGQRSIVGWKNVMVL